MNAAAAQARRVAISPYARRLARERSLPLEALRGSGPGGRILAADVLDFVPADTPEVASPAAAPSIAAARIAAFAASIALGALEDLKATLESSGRAFDIDDLLLRAIGRTFAEVPDTGVNGTALALELPAGQALFALAPEMPLASLRAARLAALADSRDETEKPAALSLRMLAATGILPVMMPLLPGRAMRLTVSLDPTGNQAECLLVADAASVDEAAAAAWLSALKSAIETPLRLLV